MDDLTRTDLDDVDDRRTTWERLVDPGSLVIGTWFVLVGLVAAVLGGEVLEDLPPVVIPISFGVTGLALLLPKRARPEPPGRYRRP